MPIEDSVLVQRDGRVGRLVLNRPGALNVLDLEMIRTCRMALDAWRQDPRVHALVIAGAGGRAFCAGGDIRAIRDHVVAGEAVAIETFFREEYALDLLIAAYPKPYVALIDGICMGGGIGVSVHGSFRVASENAVFAMPETAIALFPDVGGSYFLPRLPGAIGMFLALTGMRLRGADAVHAGFATHFVPRARLPALSAALARDGVAVLAVFAEPLPPFSLARQRPAIDHCFGADSVAEIVRRLQQIDDEWSRQTLAMMRAVSPAAVCWSFEILRRGADQALAACLDAERALMLRVVRQPDFLEGVRAVLIDKDRAPKWNPAHIEEVDPAMIAALFS